jgi:hypothetical protein
MIIKEGSRWTGNDRKTFIVLHEVKVDEHDWVHYREETSGTVPQEYSCYKESFLSRFTLNANQDK